MLSIAPDTETTGVDLYHACRPYFVTLCHSDAPKEPLFWQWRVNPELRKVAVDTPDLRQIAEWFDKADEIIFQNAKFDIRALIAVGLKWKERWWEKVHDILLSGHMLASGDNLYLDDLALKYLRVNIRQYEDKLQEIVTACRAIVKKQFPKWLIAHKEGLPGHPSMKGSSSNEDLKLWKWDTWLPTELAYKMKYPETHEYFTSLHDYALTDSSVTLAIRDIHKQILEKKGLTGIYEERRKLIKVVYQMESNGVTYSEKRMKKLYSDYSKLVKESESVCLSVSGMKELPKGGSSNALKTFLFETLKLPVVKVTKKSQAPSADKDAMEIWKSQADPNSRAGKFLRHLSRTRKCGTSCKYMDSYEKYSVRLPRTGSDCLKLHSNFGLTNTDTLRGASERPNNQNVSKQGYYDPDFPDSQLPSVREGFGPDDGREWWSADYENIELRIPAYEAGEDEMLQLFERPNDAPYYGSQHLLIAHILWTKEFEQCLKEGVSFKDKYKATLYQWTKNGDFAVTYGAMIESGTADRAYHQPGAQEKIEKRFTKIAKLNQQLIAHANKYGYVWTMTDREIGSGYPLEIPRNEWGRIRPTTPLNYHSQGTAMWCTCKAMRRCNNFLEQWNRSEEALRRIEANVKRGFERKGYYITMQIHDELVFDFPKGATPTENQDVILKCQELMEESGEDIGVPLPVDYSYHPHSWAKHTDLEEITAA